MMDFKTAKNQNLFVFGSILYIFLFLLAMNVLFPPQSDDFDAYYQAFGGLKSSIDDYLHWNSRLGDLIYVGFLAKYNASIYFDLFASILGTGFFISFFVVLFARLPKSLEDATILFLSLFFVLYFGAFGSDFLWGSGILNNLFGIVLIILSLIPYRFFWEDYFNREDLKKYSQHPKIKALGFFVLAFCSGWSIELGILVLIGHCCFLLFGFFYKVKFPAWYYAGIFGFVIGYCLLYFAPGPYERSKYFEEYLGLAEFLKLSMGNQLFRIAQTVNSFYTSSFFASILCLWFYFYIKALKLKISKTDFILCGGGGLC